MRLVQTSTRRANSRTVGAPTPPMDRSFGKSSRNGCGICAWNWVIVFIQQPCVPLRLPKPKVLKRTLPHPRPFPPLSERDSLDHHETGPDFDSQSQQQGRLLVGDSRKAHHTSAVYGTAEWARTSRVGLFAGADFEPQPDGTLRCPANHPLYPQERRAERDGTVRVVYAARIGDCRACPLREQCLAHGKETKHPRRVSAVLWPIEGPSPAPVLVPSPAPATQPILWGDWSRCQTRRRLMRLLRTQTVSITLTPAAAPALTSAEPGPFTPQERKHYRLAWEQRLARNANRAPEPRVKLHLFGIPTAFAQSIGLLSVA